MTFFIKLTLDTPSHVQWGLPNMGFPFSAWHLLQFLAKILQQTDPHSSPIRNGSFAQMKICMQILIFHALSIKRIFSEMTTNTLTHINEVC